MNPATEPVSRAEFQDLAAGVRAVALAVVLVVDYFNFRLVIIIPGFRSIFEDMLGGKPLPHLTAFVVRNMPLFLGSATAIAAGAILVTFVGKNHRTTLLVLTGLLVVAFGQIHLTWTALFAPLMTIVRSMQG